MGSHVLWLGQSGDVCGGLDTCRRTFWGGQSWGHLTRGQKDEEDAGQASGRECDIQRQKEIGIFE